MARKLKSDTLLFSATLLLLAVSMAWVYSASVIFARHKFGDANHFLVRQLLWTALGIAFLLVTMRVDYRVYKRPRVLVALLGVTVLGLLAVFLSPAVKGSHRWLGLGGVGVQPSEFAKLVAIVFAAATLEEWLERREVMRVVLIRVGAVLGVFTLLIVSEPDYGSALALTAIVSAMVFVVGLSYKWVVGAGLTAPFLAYAVLVFEPYRYRRLVAFWNPWNDRQGDGFQVVQSFIAVGSGGLWGKGFMQGVQKMFYLPEAHNDFIYAVIAEENGLVGASLVLACFCVVIWRGLRMARRTPDAYGALVAVGITAMLGLQAFVNISVVLGLLPAKGIALPFVSAGGSSMVVSLTAMGILLNLSQHTVEG
jgi:cell division protein FtsW